MAFITPELSLWIEGILSAWDIRGCAISIVQGDGPSTGWKEEIKCYGVRNVAGDPVTPQTLFALASNSKAFTSASLGLALSQSPTHSSTLYDTKVKTLYPDFALVDKVAEESASCVDVLSHMTGVPPYDESLSTQDKSLEGLVARLAHLKPSAEFRQKHQYNNMMYDLAAFLVQHLTSMPFPTYLATHIFTPLGMTSTTLSPPPSTLASDKQQYATGFWRKGQSYTGSSPDTPLTGTLVGLQSGLARDGGVGLQGAGSVWSNAVDLARWMKCLLRRGKHPETGQEIIPEKVLDQMETSRAIVEGLPLYPETSQRLYGLGFRRYNYLSTPIIEHGGAVSGFNSQVARFPAHDLALAVVMNSSPLGEFVMHIIKWRIFEVITGVPEEQRIDWNTRLKTKHLSSLLALQKNLTWPAQPLNPRPSPFPAAQLVGTYSSPAYAFPLHLTPAKILPSIGHLPKMEDSPSFMPMWGALSVFLVPWDGAVFKGVSEFVFAGEGKEAEVGGETIYTMPLDVEVDVSSDGIVLGLGIRGLAGAEWLSDATEGESVRERSEVYFTKENEAVKGMVLRGTISLVG